MSKAKVVSFEAFAARRHDINAKGAFFEMLDADIKTNPGRIQPIPRSIFDEIDEIQKLAEANRQRELLEG
ncbi:hypothetical protein ACA097_09475 [Pseudomonas sp. QL9]|uniref:hypothetical protein n=1 Tax=Pseudomonas sp. QL9 TaxID=3242725 RepID=UPI00352BC7FA